MQLEVRHLRVVDAIHREGSVSGAARRLHLTQPAVSHAVRDLEDRLGVRLFRRGGRRMVPTNEGERLLRSASVVLPELERAVYDLGQLRDGRQGVVRIATECYTCYNWLPTILHAFSESRPEIDIQIAPDHTYRVMEGLLSGQVDLAIVYSRPESAEITTKRLFADEMVLIVPPGHRLAGRTYIDATDVADEHLITHRALEESLLYRRLLAPAGVVPRRTSQLLLTEAIIETVKSGIGISVTPRWLVEPTLAAGALVDVRLTRRGLRREWYAAMTTLRAKDPALTQLISLLRRDAAAAVDACRAR